MLIPYSLWDGVITGLEIKYQKKYFTPEQYGVSSNPLESLVVLPGIDAFFGTKVCNIFIVAIPYGWVLGGTEPTESWPPAGYVDAIQRHKDTYEKFTKYETHVYMDFYIVQQVMAATPDSKFQEMMNQTKVRMQSMCSELSSYGFFMKPDITTAVNSNYFYPVIDAFYGSD